MKPRQDDNLPNASEPAAATSDWRDHEHVSEHIQLEAEKLVAQAGSTELAKKAIDVVQQRLGGDECAANQGQPPGKEPFLLALELFEQALETPVISGEVSEWLSSAMQACERVGELLRDDVQRHHEELFARIAREDPELSSRIETLRATDEQLVTVDVDEITDRLSNLLERAHATEPNELKVTQPLEEVVKQALSFIINARTQERAIATWYMEAFHRDRGEGD